MCVQQQEVHCSPSEGTQRSEDREGARADHIVPVSISFKCDEKPPERNEQVSFTRFPNGERTEPLCGHWQTEDLGGHGWHMPAIPALGKKQRQGAL